MSFRQFSEEILEKVLHFALVDEKPIPTSIEARNKYELHAYSMITSATQATIPRIYQKSHFTDTPPPRKRARRTLSFSPVLLATCTKWHRLGSSSFYHYNTFIVMHREVETFARQIGYHNSRFLQSLVLTIDAQDPQPTPRLSMLRNTYLPHVQSLRITLARTYRSLTMYNHPSLVSQGLVYLDMTAAEMDMHSQRLNHLFQTHVQYFLDWKYVGEGQSTTMGAWTGDGGICAWWMLENKKAIIIT